jgi:glucose/arabinose dehydrogenase
MAFYAPDPRQQPTLLVATLRTEQLLRLVIDPADPARVTSQEVVLGGNGRLRDVVAGRDGCAYVLTSDQDGRGTRRPGDDRVLKLCP